MSTGTIVPVPMQCSAMRCAEINTASHLIRVPHWEQCMCLSPYSTQAVIRNRALSATKVSTLT